MSRSRSSTACASLKRLAGGDRLDAASDTPGVGALAVRMPGLVRVLLWHHDDIWWEDGTITLDLAIGGSADQRDARLWRLDGTHANTHSAWQALGAPDDPTPEQIAAIRAAGELRGSNRRLIVPTARFTRVSTSRNTVSHCSKSRRSVEPLPILITLDRYPCQVYTQP